MGSTVGGYARKTCQVEYVNVIKHPKILIRFVSGAVRMGAVCWSLIVIIILKHNSMILMDALISLYFPLGKT